MEVLQTSALPLGDGAARHAQINVNVRPRMISRSTARVEAGIEEPKAGAGNGIRTRDFDLGKVALYH
jgi:hypothetical protein